MNGNKKAVAETQIQVALGLLLDGITDKNALVIDSVDHAVRKIAKTHPNELLKSCCQFCERSNKVNGDHIASVLHIMEDVCLEHIILIDGDTILLLVGICLELMVQNVIYEPHIQMPASGVLVAMGKRHCIQVMESLLKKLLPGVMPHYAVPHTLGSLTSANAFGVVPYLKTVLEIMLPLLPSLKTDPLKQAFSYAFGCFSDGLIEYVSNLEQAPDPTITVADFHVEMSSAYDILFTSWLHSREPKLVETVLHALAAVYNVLGADKVRQHTTKTVQVLLSLYRKHKEPLPIMKCLGSVISVSAKTDGTLLEPLLNNVLQVLSELVCVSPDYAQPELLRTHSEVLRCFECLAMHYSDHTIDHILGQMRNNNDKERVKGLLVLTHLTNSADSIVKSRLKDALHVLTDMLGEHNLRVKMALMKVIVAFAYKGFLSNNDVIMEKFMFFIIKLCCKHTSSKEGNFDESSELQLTADNTLYMLSTSVKELEAPLWELLLQCLFMREFNDAAIIILRCLTHLASRKAVKPSCEGAFIRCLGLLAQPIANFRGTFALNFLKNIKLCDTETYRSVWDAKIPQLLKYLEQNYDNFNEKEWEDLIFDFLSILLEAVEDESLKETFVNKIKEQLPLYTSKSSEILDGSKRHAERKLLLKCLAIISCYLANKNLIQQVVDTILGNVMSQDYLELQACAEAIGMCSRSNLQVVLTTLQTIRRDVLLKKSSKLFQFGFMKDQRSEMEVEKIRFLIISSYAEICNEASDKLLQTVESEILHFAINELSLTKDFVIRKACLRAVGCVADAMHPNRNKLHIFMQERDNILLLVSAQLQLHNGPEYIELFPVIIPVLTSLVRLPHVLESEQRIRLLKLCFDNIFNASAIYCKLNSDSYGDLKLAPNVYSSFSKLNVLVQELLIQCLSPATLDEIVTLLEPWLGRKKVEQRLPALEALRMALQTYLDNTKFAYEGPSTFGQTGLILARIVPRCTDPNKNTRKVAVECVCLVLSIAGRYEGHMRDNDKLLSNALLHIQEQIDSDDPKLLFNLTTDLAHTIAINVPQFQLPHFVDTLIDGLLDIEASSSSGASVVLNNVMKLKGSDLFSHSELVVKLLGTLGKINCSRTKATALCAILNFATHNLKAVVHILLQQPLPYDQSTCSCWSILATDSTMITDIFEQLKKLLKTTPLYEEQMNTENIRMATLATLQAICAFSELFKSNQTRGLCKQQFPELFALFYIALASYIGTAVPVHTSSDKKLFILNREAYKLSSFRICSEAFKLFLQNASSSKAASDLLLCSDSLNSFLEMVPNLTENICSENPQSLAWLVACLGPYIRTDFEPQRIAVTAFFAALLRHKVNNQSVLAENILEMLLDVQNDSSSTVRKLSLQGLGYATEYLNVDLIYRHCNLVLNAFMQGLDYNSVNESEVVLEAMLSFSKLLNVVNQKHINQCQVTAAVRIKPLLQQESGALRHAAFHLFGDLANSIGPDDAFREQVYGNLILFLLHLCDEEPEVVKACKYAMRKIGQFLESSRVNSMIQEHLIEEGALHYVQFVTDLIKVMAEDVQELFPQLVMTCLSYFKSPWLQIRANTALLIGLLYSHLSTETRTQVSLDTITYRLLQLLKDEQSEVRARAVEAIGNLFTA